MYALCANMVSTATMYTNAYQNRAGFQSALKVLTIKLLDIASVRHYALILKTALITNVLKLVHTCSMEKNVRLMLSVILKGAPMECVIYMH